MPYCRPSLASFVTVPLFFLTLRRYLRLIFLALKAPLSPGRRLLGGLLVLVGLPFFLLWQGLQWLGMLLDELFFRGYRRVDVRQPVFIIGPPRTGTTYLHHLLAEDPSTSTFRLWECLFAVSITGKKLCLGLAWLDARLGNPVRRLGRRLAGRTLQAMDDIHPLGLTEPEEDFLCFLPLATCFLLVVPFPEAHWLWRTARFDVQLTERERRAQMRYYKRCIQRHLYVFGDGRRFLSKNASFAGMTESILDEFPDARVLATVRDPEAAVPSQLSSLRPALALCGFKPISESLRDDLIELLVFYYEHLLQVARKHPDRVAFVYNDDLRHRPAESVREALSTLDVTVSDALNAALDDASQPMASTSSGHQYTLEEFGLDAELIRSRFARVYNGFQFGAIRNQSGTL